MAALTDYLENKLVDFLLRGVAYSPPGTFEIALFTSATTDAGGGTEVTGGAYERSPITANLSNFSGTQAAASTALSSGTSGETSNNVPIVFPLPTADWGTITHCAIFDAHTGGSMLAHGPLATPNVVLSGDQAPTLAIGKFKFTIDA